jgi:hypothetical protein
MMKVNPSASGVVPSWISNWKLVLKAATGTRLFVKTSPASPVPRLVIRATVLGEPVAKGTN